MWRPFAGNFANHSFENYMQKYQRSETAPLPVSSLPKAKIDLEQLYPFKHKKEDLEKRFENFQVLQEKVREQRRNIRKKDQMSKAKKDAMIRSNHSMFIHQKEKKKHEIDKLRQLLFKTPFEKHPRFHSQRRDRSSGLRSDDAAIFSLTTAENNREIKTHRSSLPPISTKPVIPLRKYQEKVITTMRNKAPNFLKELKQEFREIREQNEMTYDQYKERRKIRRNPMSYSSARRQSSDL